ncbi:hypothetical protein CC80DRAFT_556236 [Byssothecium circinans]|uniref:Beta-galactosidase trimerisation domain-containing protein n=1 Tax=Byssothecium circinans TaxID=147558 RepID=A0A6A5T7B7_9PLEO|nr:hypothetical protein CC80DRAFT_556236 [Byssothecium circinans]
MTNTSLEPGQWWRKPFSMLQTNLREIDADMDVNKVADFIEQHGATAWLIGVGGIQAQYPTKLPFQMRNPLSAQRASGDLIQDALDAAHGRGMRLLARMDFSKISAEVAQEHPDWLYVSPTGKLQNHTNGLVSVCPSGPYYQERIFDILNEVTSRYHVDGFFINWASFNEVDYFKVYYGVCYCDNCKARWKRYWANLELPNGRDDATYPQWLNFTDSVINEWTARVRDLIGKQLPDAGLLLGRNADIMFHEANNAVGRELWHHATSEAVSSLQSYRPHVPVLVNAVSFVDMPYRMGSEEPAQFAQYLLQCISRGGNPSTYIMGTPGKIPYLNFNIAGEITRFHRTWRDVYDGLQPVAKTGLVLPDEAQINGSQHDDALSEYRGLYTAMQELHVPFDVIGQENLAAMAENGGLKRYEVVVLPNLGKLASEDVTALDNWVAAGGRLVTTGSIGVEDNGVVQLKSLPAARHRDTVNKTAQLFSTYFAPPQNRTAENIYTGPLVPVTGSYHLFEWKNGTEGKYRKLAFAPFAPPEYAYGNRQVNEYGYGIGTFEKGKGIVIPFTIGRGYRELGLSVHRGLFEKVLREEGAAKEKLSANIAEQVEVIINANGPKMIVHLINMSGARKQNFGSVVPIPAGSIKVEGSNVTARALRSDRMLEVRDGRIILPGLDLFEVVVIEGLE